MHGATSKAYFTKKMKTIYKTLTMKMTMINKKFTMKMKMSVMMTVNKKIYTVNMINKEVNPTTCMTNKIVIKEEVKHMIKKVIIATASQGLAAYHTSPGEIIR